MAGATTPPLVEAKGLSWEAPDGSFCLQVPQFTLAPGERLAITGPSGAGKSTLLGLLSLALRPRNAQQLRLLGHEALGLWQADNLTALQTLRSRTLGFVPQTGALLPFLSARENIALPLARDPSSQTTSYARADLQELAEKLEIASCLDRRPDQLSVGQRQRVAVARALINRRPLILADEPSAALHPLQARRVMELLHGLPASQAGVIMVTHDAALARNVGFRCLEVQMHTPRPGAWENTSGRPAVTRTLISTQPETDGKAGETFS
ncbi:ABC transporter ATP-binding protein [Oecophyllibacter saccharovorans]|uniref:ABC transporter ATP-binding protein n=1 Tax=Oecophyllibacter saccharovorans TaxID=2558360 RepID=UPI001171A272|nr:ATP-binding cassette domain-containing protein [Oecophyllibacter saccharovorans]TPW36322.1 ATP-binding cassette domain-containing protein [Oecophyllibacter saccharovorans]